MARRKNFSGGNWRVNERRCLRALKDQTIAEQKICERADGYGDQVRDCIVHVHLADERSHDQEISGQRDRAVDDVKLQKPRGR